MMAKMVEVVVNASLLCAKHEFVPQKRDLETWKQMGFLWFGQGHATLLSRSEFYGSIHSRCPKGVWVATSHNHTRMNTCLTQMEAKAFTWNHDRSQSTIPHILHGGLFHRNEILTQLHWDNRRSSKGLRTHIEDW